MPIRRVERALIVEDDDRLRSTLVRVLQGWAEQVRSAARAAEGGRLMQQWEPELAVLDVRLPDGDARDVLRDAGPGACPAIVAISGAAGPDEAFELAGLGVQAYVSKPLDLQDLEAALERALTEAPELGRQVRRAVGRVGLRELEADVRAVMVDEALRRAQGSRRGAARLLAVSRQMLQHVLRHRGELPDRDD